LHAPASVAVFLPHKGQIVFGLGRWVGRVLETHFERRGVGEDEAIDEAAELDWEAEKR
jgi:hypothetical protein